MSSSWRSGGWRRWTPAGQTVDHHLRTTTFISPRQSQTAAGLWTHPATPRRFITTRLWLILEGPCPETSKRWRSHPHFNLKCNESYFMYNFELLGELDHVFHSWCSRIYTFNWISCLFHLLGLWDKFVIVSRQHTDVKSALLFACSLLKSVFWISLSDDEWSGELCWRASQWGQTVAHPGASVDHPNTESVQDIKYVHTQITHFSEGGEGKSW